jgi:pimeloyl-ACP methyl ester carboxylesterase
MRRRRLRLALRVLGWLTLALTGWVLGNALRVVAVERFTPEQAAPGSGRWIAAHDVRLHVVERGAAGAPVVLLAAGTGAWAGTWISNVDAIVESGWRVVAVDLPPFGFSQRPADRNYSRRAQAQRLLAAIRSLEQGPVVLLGHSYGGGPAAEAAMIEPALVRHLVLVDASIGLRAVDAPPCERDAGDAGAQRGARTLRTALVANTGTQPLLTAFWLEQFVARREVVTEERAAIYRVPFRVQDTSAASGDWAWQFAAGCEPALSSTAAGFAGLKMPLTLLWGELDTVTPPEQARAIAAAAPISRLIVLGGVGHIPQIEDPALFNRRLIDVLDTLR